MTRGATIATGLLLALLAILAGCASPGSTSPASTHALAAAETLRHDDSGQNLDAHDGEIVMAAGQAVLIGTSYDCGFRYNDPAASFCGFRAYTSPDLVHWRDAGPLFDASTAYWQHLCAHGAFGCYRPHEIYLASARHWVLWVNVPGGYRVLESAHATGPFASVRIPRVAAFVGGLHFGAFGDEGLAVDPATGRGYLAYTGIVLATNAHDIVFQQLDAAGTDVVGRATRLGASLVEAPSLYSLGGSWWVAYSDPACPYCSGTGTSLARAPTPLGPWAVVGSLTATSCGGQPAAVDLLTLGGRRQVVFQSDLWDHGDSNEARARTYLSPVTPDGAGRLPRVSCRSSSPP